MFDLPTILKPNATEHDRALEQAMRKGKPDLTPIAKLMNPDTCPAHLLGWLAWAFSVDVWDTNWSEEQKRSVLTASLEVHRKKGTIGALRRVLAAVGFEIEVSEWFEHGGAPHTFRVTAFNDEAVQAGFVIDPTLFARLKAQIEAVKPVRSHLELVIGESFTTEIRFCGASIDQAFEALPHDVLVAQEQFESESATQVAVLDIATSTDTHNITVKTTDFQAQASTQSTVIHSGVDTILHDVQTRGSA